MDVYSVALRSCEWNPFVRRESNPHPLLTRQRNALPWGSNADENEEMKRRKGYFLSRKAARSSLNYNWRSGEGHPECVELSTAAPPGSKFRAVLIVKKSTCVGLLVESIIRLWPHKMSIICCPIRLRSLLKYNRLWRVHTSPEEFQKPSHLSSRHFLFSSFSLPSLA